MAIVNGEANARRIVVGAEMLEALELLMRKRHGTPSQISLQSRANAVARHSQGQGRGSVKVLVACEFSGIVRDAFIAKGHDAISCDLLPTERPGPHYQGDVLSIVNGEAMT